MVTAIQIYQTSDGKKFDNQVDAMAHEFELSHSGVVDQFITRNYPPAGGGKKNIGPTRTIARKAVMAWLYESEHGMGGATRQLG